MFLELLPDALLAAVFPQRSIVHQQEVRVETIKTGPLAQRVPQRLVGPEHLEQESVIVKQKHLDVFVMESR